MILTTAAGRSRTSLSWGHCKIEQSLKMLLIFLD